MGQRLQRQGKAWQAELEDWKKFCKQDQIEKDRATLGCAILLRFCDLLHTGMFQSNSETVDPSRTVPPRSGEDCSLLLSVTDPKLPTQPGSNVRNWFPKERQLKQPQTDEAIESFRISAQKSASSLSLPKSADLEELLKEKSLDDLTNLCEQLNITRIEKLNRLQMAESILFHRALKSCESATTSIRHQPELKGKVSIIVHGWSCVQSHRVLTSVIPYR